MSTFNDTSSSDRSAGSAEALHGHDLAHHVTAKPLELQYSELVAIHFGSFALSRAPLMTRRKAKKFVKYLWSITAGLLPYEGPVQLPQISLQDINYIRFALDELSTGAYLKLSFTEWAQDYSWADLQEIWSATEEIDAGEYLNRTQRDLAVQLRESIENSRHPILDSPPPRPLFPWDQPASNSQTDDESNVENDTDATLVD
ncbi:hypothetical protein FRC05_006247 [Tulasnella sp. 425]|nr:hypothetical protein FRC05_006247 [Tulasnella sp. 425]